jgi:hypothetical protein
MDGITALPMSEISKQELALEFKKATGLDLDQVLNNHEDIRKLLIQNLDGNYARGASWATNSKDR